MAARLAGKVCLVTGAGSRGDGIGNGRAVAILFAREGAHVLAIDREAEAAHATVAMIAAEGGDAEAFVGDLTDGATAQGMAACAIERWGAIDVLHNNIGITGEAGDIVDTTDEEWDHVMAVNVRSTILASRSVIPTMVRAGTGVVLNTSSLSALRPRNRVAYTTSKGALIALTQAMAVQHGHQGIRVNCILPGPVYTPLVADAGMTEALRERRREASLLQREGTAWDVAHAAVYLASDEAAYVTGVVLPVDGGVGLASPER